MTAPGGGGDRLEVSVVADASGFARDAQAKIDAAAARVKAKVQVEVDDKRLAAELKAKAEAASKAGAIKVRVSVDEDYFRSSLDRMLAGALGRDLKIKVGVDVDRSQLDRALADSAKGGGTITQRVETVGGGDVHTNVRADTAEAAAEVDAFVARENSQRKIINVGVRVDQEDNSSGGARGGRGIRAITGGMSGLEKAGFYAGMVQTLSSAVDSLGSGLISVSGAASQAVGALAALPNLAGVAAQGVGSLVLGFSGVMGAVKALTKADTAASTAANGNGKAQADALRRVTDARKSLAKAQTDQQRTAVAGDRSVADAQRAVSDAVTAAAGRLHAAEEGVASAQHSSMLAQQALTQARKDAEQTLKDYKDQLADAALSEESATLAIQRARENWNKTMRSPVSTELDRKEADLALRQAEQNLTDIQDRNAQLRQQAADATKAGVEGAANVVTAKDNVTQATQSQADAEDNLAKTQTDNARSIADAQTKLADAQEKRDQNNADALDRVVTAQEAVTRALADQADQSNSVAKASSLAAAAMAKLSPAGREFVHFIKDELQPKFYDLRNAVQEALLGSVERGVRAAMPLLATLQTGLEQSATVMGGFIQNLGTMLGSPAFRADAGSIMASNSRALGSFAAAGLDLVTVFENLAVAAEPLVERFATWVDKWAQLAASASTTGRETGKLQAFMQRAGDRAAQLGDIIGNLAQTLFHMGKAGTDSGGDLLDTLQKLTQKWSDWTGSAKGQDKMHDYFTQMEPAIKEIGKVLGDVVKLIVDLGGHGESLKIILGIIDAVVKALDWIFTTPVIGPLAAGIAGLLGASVLLLSFIKKLSKIKDLFDGIGKAAGSVKSGVGRVQDIAEKRRGTTSADRAATSDGEDTAARGRNPARTAPTVSAKKRLNQTRQNAQDRTQAADDARAQAINDRYPIDTSRRRSGTTATSRRRGSASTSAVLDDLDSTTSDLINGTNARIRGGASTGRAQGRLRGAAGRVVTRLRSEESGNMRADFGLTGRDRSSASGEETSAKATGRTRAAAGRVTSGAKRAGGAVGGGIGAVRSVTSDGAPRTAAASDGQEVGGLGGEVAGFAGAVQSATAKASTYVGGWAGQALKDVSGFAGGASKVVANWSESGVGKAVSTAGGYVTQFASGNGDTLKRWAGNAKTAAVDMAKGAGDAIKDIGPKIGSWVSGLKDLELGQKLAAAAGKIWAGVQAALNLVMDANPIMLVVIAVAALVAGFIWAWNNIDGFKQFFLGAWDAIQGAVSAVIDWIKDHWPLLLAILTGPIGLVVLFIIDHWTQIRDFTVAAFDFIRDKVAAAWDWVWSHIRDVFSTLAGWLSGAYIGVRDGIVGAFNWVRDKVVAAFEWIRDKVGAVWDGIKHAIRDPLDAIINVVYNKGVVPVYNWINDLWGGKDLTEYHLPEFATGGVLPGYAPGQDTRLVRMSPGEGVLVPEAVRGLGGESGIKAINSHFSNRVAGPGLKKGLPAFAGGGVLGGIWGSITGAVGSAIDAGKGLLAKGWKAAVHAATLPIRAESNLIPGNGSVGQGFRDSINSMMDKLETMVGGKERDSQAAAAKNAGNVSGGVARWAGLVSQVLTELGQPTSLTPYVLQLIAHESGGNPSAINLTDINAQRGDPSIGLMQVIGSTFRANAGPYVGLGQRDPHASIYSGLHYGIGRYGSVMNIPGIKSLAHGGAYKPYDTGGRWADGTTGINTSGKDEGVLTGRGVAALGGWARLDALNDGTPLAQLVSTGASAAGHPVTAGGGVGTYISEGAIQVTTVNPAPEPASDTLNRTLRRVADLGIFGAAPAGG